MAGEIAVTPDRLRTISAKMQSGAKEVEAILSRLSDHVAPVRSEWTGPAQAYFDAFWDQSLHDAHDLRTVLVGMATLTETAATAYETTERRIAELFGEFRANPDTVWADADNDDENLDAPATTVVDVAGAQPAIDWVDGVPENESKTGEFSEFEEILTAGAPRAEIATEGTAAVLELATNEDADQLAGGSKTNGRLPWVRFMTKSARSEVGDTVVGPRVPERRFKTSDPALKPGSRLCRLCFTVVSLEPGLIEKTATHDYVRCPHCGNSFPVRHGDTVGQELSQ